jgi:hypothetical protein
VSFYTITIIPDDVANPSATLRVRLDGTGTRIRELTLRAGEGDGFALEELTGFSLIRLINAIAPTDAEDAAGTALAAVGTSAADRVHARAGGAAGSGSRARAATGTTATATGDRRPERRGRTGRPRAAERKAATARKPEAGAATRDRRAYRRMPDDVVEVYRQAGGATALARHYGVPRHTAQGWLRRLRQQGAL